MRWLLAAILLLALGATLGSALDAIHTHTGTTEYPAPVWMKMAWWTPLLFGVAGVAVGLPRAALERGAPPPTRGAVAGGMALFVLAYALSGTLPGNVARAVVLFIIFAASWWSFDRTRLGLALALLTGLGGCAVEVLLIRQGAFRHLQPTWLGIPLWLPWLYAAAQVGVASLGRRLVHVEAA
jgi:hypothetical protein